MPDDASVSTVDLRPTDLTRPSAATPRGSAPAAGEESRPRAHRRILHGLRRPDNWLELVRFSIVGATGFAVNLAIYDLAVKGLGIQYLVAEVFAWILAAGNNFIWNRHWTFRAGEGQAHVQAFRFLLVSLVALGVNLLILRGLVELGDLDKLLAEALALAASTPLNFLGNKLWSFRLDLYPASPSSPED